MGATLGQYAANCSRRLATAGIFLALALALLSACAPEPEWAQDPLLKRVLQQSYSGPRARALYELNQLDEPRRRTYVPAIVNAMREDDNPYVRLNAAYALGTLGPLATDAVPALEQTMEQDEHEDVRWMARETLAILGHNTDAMLEDMVLEYRALMGRTELAERMRRHAVMGSILRIVQSTGHVRPDVVAVLADALDDIDTNIGVLASQALFAAADTDPATTAAAAPALHEMVGHRGIGHIAALTLEKLAAAEAIPPNATGAP